MFVTIYKIRPEGSEVAVHVMAGMANVTLFSGGIL